MAVAFLMLLFVLVGIKVICWMQVKSLVAMGGLDPVEFGEARSCRFQRFHWDMFRRKGQRQFQLSRGEAHLIENKLSV